MQEQDQNIGPLYRWSVTGKRPTLSDVQMESTETRYYLLLWESLRLIDGLVYREFHKKDGTDKFLQLLVPQLLRRDIMFQCMTVYREVIWVRRRLETGSNRGIFGLK